MHINVFLLQLQQPMFSAAMNKLLALDLAVGDALEFVNYWPYSRNRHLDMKTWQT